jgi:hypothetical protein
MYLFRLKHHHKFNILGYPIVGVLGCMAERLKTSLLEEESVDFVCGPDAYRDIPLLVDIATSTGIDPTVVAIPARRFMHSLLSFYCTFYRALIAVALIVIFNYHLFCLFVRSESGQRATLVGRDICRHHASPRSEFNQCFCVDHARVQ